MTESEQHQSKSESTLTLSKNAIRLFQVVNSELNKPEKSADEVPRIEVSELISKVGFYYEKLRNAVDYKEDHLLRKNAIARILKRQIVIQGAIKELDSQEISKFLLMELIRASYLPNNTIPEEKIKEVAQIIEKYKKLRRLSLPLFQNGMKEKNELTSWVITLMASDIEQKLVDSSINDMVVQSMYQILIDIVRLSKDSPYTDDLEIQIFLSIYRNFLKYDKDMLSYILLKYYYPEWEAAGDSEIEKIAKNLIGLRHSISAQIDHPLVPQLNVIAKRYTIFFSVLVDVIQSSPNEMYKLAKTDHKKFTEEIEKICKKRYKQAKSKLWRAAVRSIIYIFLTKSVFAVLLEVPVITFFNHHINLTSLVVNISFPALLLFVVVLFTRLPKKANSNKIINGIDEIMYVERKRQDLFILRKPAKRAKWKNILFGIIYSITFLLTFGFIIWALDQIKFHWISMIIFLFFLALVSFFIIRIRKGIKEMSVAQERPSILSLLVDFFYMPIIATGKWLSEKFDKINFFVFIMDFIIEAPFKIVLEIAEEWTKYVKERKDEIA